MRVNNREKEGDWKWEKWHGDAVSIVQSDGSFSHLFLSLSWNVSFFHDWHQLLLDRLQLASNTRAFSRYCAVPESLMRPYGGLSWGEPDRRPDKEVREMATREVEHPLVRHASLFHHLFLEYVDNFCPFCSTIVRGSRKYHRCKNQVKLNKSVFNYRSVKERESSQI